MWRRLSRSRWKAITWWWIYSLGRHSGARVKRGMTMAVHLPRPHSAPLRARYAPDHIADIVRHQERAVVGTERDPDRPSVGRLFVGSEEAGQNIARRPGRAAVLERHEDELVAA